MEHCKCGRELRITPQQRERIRSFTAIYWFIPQKHMAKLFNVSVARISEIVRMDTSRGGV